MLEGLSQIPLNSFAVVVGPSETDVCNWIISLEHGLTIPIKSFLYVRWHGISTTLVYLPYTRTNLPRTFLC